MTYKTLIATAALLCMTACQNSGQNSDEGAPVKTSQSEAELVSCIRTIMKLDEGKWEYMGTIARGNGMFRTFATTSVHEAAEPDMWAFRSFGGDVGEEYSGDVSYSKLVGTSLIPFEDDALKPDEAVKFLSCTGPDAEGRYETTKEYSLPYKDEETLTAKNMTWYSEHGSYYAEDIVLDSGRVLARRSGVNTPAEE